jgi:hypothetical protein
VKAVLILAIIAFASVYPDTQGWRGIVPLRSDCTDVKQKLGITECRSGAYDVSDAQVSLVFSEGRCSSGWNVPAGIVLSVDVRPKVRRRVSDLKLDMTSYQRVVDPKNPKLVRYVKNDQSLRISVNAKGFVTNYSYGPSTNDEALKCQAEPGAHGTGSFKFDEYGAISEDDENARLDNLAFQLRSSDWLGYIITYDGPSTAPKRAYARGERARAYLMQKGVDGKRVFVVDGGRREEMTIELFATIPGTIPPSPRPTIP